MEKIKLTRDNHGDTRNAPKEPIRDVMLFTYLQGCE